MSIINSTLIILLIVSASYFLKRFGLLAKEDGRILLTKIIFYVTLPMLVFSSISKIPLHRDLLLLILAAPIIQAITFPIALWIANLFKLERATKGSFIVGTMIMNTGMVAYPFFQLLYGKEGLAKISLFDLGNGIITFTAVYFIATSFSIKRDFDLKESVKKVILLPALWGIILGIFVSGFEIRLPELIVNLTSMLGVPTVPLLLVSLGLYFEFQPPKNLAVLISAVAIRTGLGLLLAFLLVTFFNLQGLESLVVLIGSATPAGYNTLVFAAKERLDEDFAAAFVTYSIIAAVILIPILLFYFS